MTTVKVKSYTSLLPLFLVALILGSFSEGLAVEIPKDSKLYSDLIPLFKTFHANLAHLYILDRKSIDRTYTILLVQAMVPPEKLDTDFHKEETFKQDAFGIFIIDSLANAHYMTLDIFATRRWGDYEVRIIEYDDRHMIVLRQGESYGDVYDKVNYFYDLKERRLLNRIAHLDMRIYSMIKFQNALYMIGTGDNETTVITRLNVPQQPRTSSSYEIIDRIHGEKIPLIHKVSQKGPTLILTAESKQYLFDGQSWMITTNPNPDSFRHNAQLSGQAVGLPHVYFWVPLFQVKENLVFRDAGVGIVQRWLVWNSRISLHSSAREYSSGIYELASDGSRSRFYPFPNPNYDLFRKYRPRRVSDGYTRAHTTTEVEIGPFQLEANKLWFGTSFYDGEGTTGIGGVGYFDVDSKKYRVIYDKQLADWSSSSIYVDKKYVWLGMVHYPEGKAYSGGLLKYNKANRNTKRYPVPAIISVIRREGNHLYLGTTEGLYILSNERLTHVAFVLTTDHRYILSITNL